MKPEEFEYSTALGREQHSKDAQTSTFAPLSRGHMLLQLVTVNSSGFGVAKK
ncbi:MAG: hypothetical protein M0Z39_11830 [Actinomycetota bacterium]|jgi:hypothetical protein|nr:hypothetical protein [Actinomycetota bacterium]